MKQVPQYMIEEILMLRPALSIPHHKQKNTVIAAPSAHDKASEAQVLLLASPSIALHTHTHTHTNTAITAPYVLRRDLKFMLFLWHHHPFLFTYKIMQSYRLHQPLHLMAQPLRF
jgi:hypothetical protein